jgi:hypothetical protein
MKRCIAVLSLFLLVAVGVTAQEQESDPVLYALGAVGVSNLYFSYSFLGSVADGVASGVYDPVTASDLTDDAISLNTSSRDVLTGLLDASGLSDDDKRTLEEMIEAHSLLIQEAWGLLSYIDDPSDSEDFRYYRDQAWNAISSLFAQDRPSASPARP